MVLNEQQIAINSAQFGKNLSKSDRDRIEKMHEDMREAIKTAMLAAVKKKKQEKQHKT